MVRALQDNQGLSIQCGQYNTGGGQGEGTHELRKQTFSIKQIKDADEPWHYFVADNA